MQDFLGTGQLARPGEQFANGCTDLHSKEAGGAAAPRAPGAQAGAQEAVSPVPVTNTEVEMKLLALAGFKWDLGLCSRLPGTK